MILLLLLQIGFHQNRANLVPAPCSAAEPHVVLTYGDSKTVPVAGLPDALNEFPWQLDLIDNSHCHINHAQLNVIATAGIRTSQRKTLIDAELAAATYTPRAILYNLGSNDAYYSEAEAGDEATWKTNVAYIWDAMHAKWPSAQIWYSETWRQGYDAESDRMAVWYAELAVGRDYIHLCDNERSWVKGSDDGATMFWDGVHFSYAGVAEKARRAAACLGY